MYWKEVVVYMDSDYSTNCSIWVPEDSTKSEISEKIKSEIGDSWYSYDFNI